MGDVARVQNPGGTGLFTQHAVKPGAGIRQLQRNKSLWRCIAQRAVLYFPPSAQVKLVLQRNKFFVESGDPAVLRRLLRDEVVQRARARQPDGGEFVVSRGLKDQVGG